MKTQREEPGMRRGWVKQGWMLALARPVAAPAQVDLSALDKDMSGEPAQVLVLGSVHLSGMPDEFEPGTLEPVLERPMAFRPDVIAIETMSGEECGLATRPRCSVAGVGTFHRVRKLLWLDVPHLAVMRLRVWCKCTTA